MDWISWIAFFIFLIALGVLGVWYFRDYLTGSGTGTGLFGGTKEKRLAVVEQATVDGRRKLVLIRRDDIEHLIMTGGPVDVLIESGIGQRRVREPVSAVADNVVYSRAPRVAQAPGE